MRCRWLISPLKGCKNLCIDLIIVERFDRIIYMNRHYSEKIKHDVITLLPGEVEVSKDVALHTLLGSCVSAVLYNENRSIGGINHIILPTIGNNTSEEQRGRYGIYAMELLINKLMKLGIAKNSLKAKLFGGSNMLGIDSKNSQYNIGQRNIDFALNFLQTEKIPVIATDIGGLHGRNIYYLPLENKVLVSKVSSLDAIEREESLFIKSISKKPKSKIVLFDD